MNNTTDFSNIKGQTPISIIVHGGNYTGYLLAKTLLEQGSQVVIIDKYTADSKTYFSDLKKTGKVNFIDFKGLKNFFDKISRIDYLYYLLGPKLEKRDTFESKDFLSESDYINTSLVASQKFKAKISLITSLKLNRDLSNRVNNFNVSKPSPYSNLELQRYCENFIAEFTDKTKANTRIIRLGTLFGKGVDKVTDDILDKLLTDATKKPQIEILGEGLEIHNIINESDAIYGILKLTFSEKTRGEVVTLANKNDYTTLSLAYKLLELDVESKAIKFVERTDFNPVMQDLYAPAPHATEYGWTQNVQLESTIVQQLQSYYSTSDKKWDISEKKQTTSGKEALSTTTKTSLGIFVSNFLSPIKNLTSSKTYFKEIDYSKIVKLVLLTAVSILAIYFLIAPVIGIGIGSLIISTKSKDIKEDIASLNFENMNSNAEVISQNLDKIDENLSRIYWIFQLTSQQNTYNNISQLLQGTTYALDSVQDFTGGLTPLAMYIKEFQPSIGFGGSSDITNSREYREYLEKIDSHSYNIKEGIYKISLAQNLIEGVEINKMPKFLQDKVLYYKNLIDSTSNTVKPLGNITQFLPDLLGVNERKRYLILLQNDGEIRSTGGWISSYSVVGLEGGQIRELFVDDIYNADGTLKVQGKTYKAPNSMVRALGDTPYSFSLVNWDPNLDTVMTSSEQFIYDLGKGDDIDGIITIDTMFLQKLLDKWGGIEVPGESEIITSDNLYGKIFEMHSEFTPGSSRKSTFLAELANQVITKIFSSNYEGYKDIADVISSSLDEKHLQATFKNTLARSYFDTNNWDGNIDTKYLNTPIDIDWNWGANKANLYLKKNYTLEIDIKDENTIDYTYQIAVQNESTQDVYPQGQYTNYVRIYLPQNAQVTGIKGIVDNKYDIYSESGYKIIGGWFNTPIGKINTLEISYRLSNDSAVFPIKKENSFLSLDLNIYKQPGSKKDAYNITVTYPTNWILGSSGSLSTIGNQLNRRFDLASDQEFNLTWEK